MRSLHVTRNTVSAAGLTVVAIVLMIVSTILFAPAPRHANPPLLEAVVAALLGAVALYVALRLSKHKVEVQQAAEHVMTGTRAQWFLILPGLGLLALGTEMSANVLKTETLPFQSAHVQFATLFAGLALFTLGMIGVRRVSLPRIHRREVLPVLAIFALALFVRGYELDKLVRLSVDEGHHMFAIFPFFQPNAQIKFLTTTSGILPTAMFYEYGNYITSLVWGRNMVGLRMENAILGSLTVLAVYGVGRSLFNRRIGITSALILATFPVHLFNSRISLPHIGDALFCTLAIMFAIRGYQHNRRSDWILMGVCVGMAQHFFEAARLLIPPVFVCWIIFIAVVRRGRFKVLRRGIFLAAITSLVVITPMYFTMWVLQAPFNSRLSSSGVDVNLLQRAVSGELNEGERIYLLDHVTDPFLVYTFHMHRGLMEMYGGFEPLVLRVCVPLFLLGFFHALWRIRSGISLLLILMFGTSVGNIFVADAVIFPRYILVTPVLALFVGIGLGCTLPMLNPFVRRAYPFEQPPVFMSKQRRWLTWRAVPLYVLALFFAAVQLYYFSNHLIPEFNTSARDLAPSGDIADAGLRFMERPNARHEQMIVYDSGYGVVNTVNERFAFSLGVIDYWAEMYLSTDIMRETLDALPRDRTYIFFVLPSDTRMIALLEESFHLDAPTYSAYTNPVMRSLYVMFVAPQAKNPQPRPVEQAGVLAQSTRS